jgi:hypothetical protein
MSERDLDDDELDLLNIQEPNFSAFATLFFEHEKMMVHPPLDIYLLCASMIA